MGFSCISVCHSSTLGEGLGGQGRQKPFGPEFDQPGLGLAESVRAEALRAFRGDDQRAARLEDVERRHHALDGLIVGLVERIAGRGRDDGLEPARHRDAGRVGDEVTAA